MKKGTACLHSAARLGLTDKLKSALNEGGGDVGERDHHGKTPLHHAIQHEEALELLLDRGADPGAQDSDGCTPLHLAVAAALPMASYLLAAKLPAACLTKAADGKTPLDLAASGERGEVLNALLLACSGHGGEEALTSMRQLLRQGAVCDTWAPNGSSALMLAASIDCAPGVELLLGNGATVELQDALGRTALMFAAGNDATAALAQLLAAGASVSIRDRRGRNVMDYAVRGSAARRLLEEHLTALESRATELQAALLAELCGDAPKQQQQQQPAAAAQQSKAAKKGKKKKGSSKSKGKAAGPAAAAAAAEPGLAAVAEEGEEEVAAAAAAAAEEDAGDSAPPAVQEQQARSRQQGSEAQEQQQHGAEAPGARQVVGGDAPRAALGAAAGSDSAPDSDGAALEAAPWASSSGRSSLDVSRSPSPPGSPGGWCTVGKPRGASKPVAVPAAAAAQQAAGGRAGSSAGGAAGLPHHPPQHPHHLHGLLGSHGRAGRFEGGSSLDSSASRFRRCPSNGSLSSTESHDTDTSRLSGSERSVLRAVSRGALGGLHSHHHHHLPQQQSAVVSGKAAAAAKGGRSLLPPTAGWAGAHTAQQQQQQQAAAAEQPKSPRPVTWAKVTEGVAAAPPPPQSPAAAVRCASPLPAAGISAAAALSLPAEPVAAPALAVDAAAGDGSSAAPAAGLDEASALREQVARLQQAQRDAEMRHRHELAAVLEDAAQHEALAVQQAVSAERMNCIVRFASFLQHNGSTLCTSFPELFAPQGGCAALRGGLGAGALPLRIPPQQQQPQWGCGAGPGSSGAASPLESLLASAANNNGCLGASPPSAGAAFASLGFAPAGPAKFFGSGGLAPLAARPQAAGAAPDLFSTLLDGGSPLAASSPLAAAAGSPFATTPLASSPLESTPFSFQDVEARLRGEFKGNHSAFVVPAAPAEPDSPRSTSLLSSSLALSLDSGL